MGKLKPRKNFGLRSASPLDRLQEAGKLPAGHVEKQKAEEIVEREYKASHDQELAFSKRLPRRFRKPLDPDVAREVISSLCSLTGTSEPKIVFASMEVHPMAAAHCAWKELHFRWGCTNLSTLIHELAHHVNNMDRRGGGSHGEAFIWTEQFLFDLFMDEILPVWKLKEQGLT